MNSKKNILIILLILIITFSCKNNEYKKSSNVAVNIAKNGLNLRKKPSLKSKKISTIPYMARVKVMKTLKKQIAINGVSGYWSEVVWENKSGWVFNAYLKSDFNKDKYTENISEIIDQKTISTFIKQNSRDLNVLSIEFLKSKKYRDANIELYIKSVIRAFKKKEILPFITLKISNRQFIFVSCSDNKNSSYIVIIEKKENKYFFHSQLKFQTLVVFIMPQKMKNGIFICLQYGTDWCKDIIYKDGKFIVKDIRV